MNRALAVARIHLMDRANAVILPWAILALSFSINLLLWWLVPESAGEGTGGILSLYGFAVAMIVVLIGRGFPFQVGLGVTRRDFFVGTVLFITAFALVSAVILIGLNYLERATGGFGLGGRYFRVPWFTDVPAPQLLVVYSMPMFFFIGIGMIYAAIWSRFKMIGSVALTFAFALLVVGAVAVINWQDGWSGVGDWFEALTPILATLLIGAIGAAAIVGSWLILRRAPV